MSAPGDALITRASTRALRRRARAARPPRRRRQTPRRRVYQVRPGAFEWFEAVEDYNVARNNGTVTEAHRAQVRATWRVIKDQVELDSDRQTLMDEVMGIQ